VAPAGLSKTLTKLYIADVTEHSLRAVDGHFTRSSRHAILYVLFYLSLGSFIKMPLKYIN
jgi:hypothetical protein